MNLLFLFIIGTLGGGINAIAGGGGILLYPALLAAGVPPINANATVSFAVLPGTLTAVVGYRAQLRQVAKHFLWLVIPCAAGAYFGASFLSHINPVTFETLSPWLVFSAVLLLALQARIHRLIINEKRLVKTTRRIAIPLLYIAVFGLAVYGGFFGAGFGLMMLALLGLSPLKNSYQMSAVKNLCGVGITGVAAAFFAAHGLLDMSRGIILAGGTAVGGYVGARMAQKVSAHLVHNLTIAIGLIISAILLVRS